MIKIKHLVVAFQVVLFVMGVTFMIKLTSVVNKQTDYINEMTQTLDVLQQSNQFLIDDNERLTNNFLRQEEQISVLEEAVSPSDKRWAKIKKVRDAVVATIKKEGFPRNLNINGLTTYAGAVVDFSEQYDVSIPLILAITTQESAFNPHAISKAGAQGIMQLMPATAKECSVDVNKSFYSITKIQDNVQLGTWYVSKMMSIFDGDVELAIRAYNAGPVYVKRVLAGELENYPKETVNYHQKVMNYREQFLKMGL